MLQKFIPVNGLSISYVEKNPHSERSIFFIHGNSISCAFWRRQLESPALTDYRLIAIDLPAHGASDMSLNPEQDYTVPGLALIMAHAIQELSRNQPYLLAGLSLGTNILAEALKFDMKPAGIVLAGCCLVGGKYSLDILVKPGTSVHVVFSPTAPEEEVRKYASEVMYGNKEEDVIEFVNDYYNVKSPFRSVLLNSILQQQYNNEIELVNHVKVPVLLIFGDKEEVVNTHYLDDAPLNLWMNTIYKIPEAGHLVNVDQPELFNSLLAEYASDVFSKTN